ncbi:hypothetical protein E5S70_38555 [Ensifer adhaerens]|nr:hypothetical protein [Ensifer canadensis]
MDPANGKKGVRTRPAETSKADALERFMTNPPFRGRRPLAIGDDLTDETMAMGGYSIRIGRPSACFMCTRYDPVAARSARLFSFCHGE